MTNISSKVIKTALVAAFAVSAHAQLVTNFDSFPTSPLPGGADSRVPGNASTWWVPDNAATSGEVRSGVGLGGTNGLVIGNRGNGNDGVITNVLSGRLAGAAGESTAPVNAPFNSFESSFWFRTASATAVTGFSFKTEVWGTDRTTYLGFFSNAGGNLYAGAYDINTTLNDFEFHTASGGFLNWGEWYRVVTQIKFNDGPDNDVVNQLIYKADGSLFGSVTGIKTWEEGQRQYGYNGGVPVAVDSVSFQARGAPTGDIAYIDDVSIRSFNTTSVPDGSATVVLLGGALLGLATLRRKFARA